MCARQRAVNTPGANGTASPWKTVGPASQKDQRRGPSQYGRALDILGRLLVPPPPSPSMDRISEHRAPCQPRLPHPRLRDHARQRPVNDSYSQVPPSGLYPVGATRVTAPERCGLWMLPKRTSGPRCDGAARGRERRPYQLMDGMGIRK